MNGLRSLDADAGPARRISERDADRLISAALDDVFPEVSEVRPRPRVASVTRRRTLAVLIAATLVLGMMGAAFAYRAHHRAHANVTSTNPVAPANTVIAKPSSSVLVSAPANVEPVAPAVAPPTPKVASAPSASAKGPEDLLRTANELRGKRRWAEAEQTYARVVASFPGSASAYAARVAAASLRLESLGDPAGALRFFQEAMTIRPGGALSEEARYGIAEAYRRLGNTKAEEAALRSFVAAHPASLMKGAAERRLTEISANEKSDTSE